MLCIGLVLLVVGLVIPNRKLQKIGAVLILFDITLALLFVASHR